MRRVASVVGIVLLCVVMLGVATAIVVKVATYDGRSPMEKLEDEMGPPPTVSLASCPGHLPPQDAVSAGNTVRPNAVLPSGATTLDLCDYYGFGTDTGPSYERQEKLAAHRHVEGAAVSRIVREFIESKRLSGLASTGCPNDDGERTLAIFRYRGSPRVAFEVVVRCRFASSPGRPPVKVSKRLLRMLAVPRNETVASVVAPEDSN